MRVQVARMGVETIQGYQHVVASDNYINFMDISDNECTEILANDILDCFSVEKIAECLQLLASKLRLGGSLVVGGKDVRLFSKAVINGQINSTITMPNSGGIIDFDIAFMDPLGTRSIGTFDAPTYMIDANPPVILDSSIEQLSRYHLDDVGIGVNVDEDVSWSGQLNLTCQILSSEVQWEEVTISSLPSNVFQGKTLFSFNFDFSSLGDPSLLSPEANMDCWASGKDDSGGCRNI